MRTFIKAFRPSPEQEQGSNGQEMADLRRLRHRLVDEFSGGTVREEYAGYPREIKDKVYYEFPEKHNPRVFPRHYRNTLLRMLTGFYYKDHFTPSRQEIAIVTLADQKLASELLELDTAYNESPGGRRFRGRLGMAALASTAVSVPTLAAEQFTELQNVLTSISALPAALAVYALAMYGRRKSTKAALDRVCIEASELTGISLPDRTDASRPQNPWKQVLPKAPERSFTGPLRVFCAPDRNKWFTQIMVVLEHPQLPKAGETRDGVFKTLEGLADIARRLDEIQAAAIKVEASRTVYKDAVAEQANAALMQGYSKEWKDLLAAYDEKVGILPQYLPTLESIKSDLLAASIRKEYEDRKAYVDRSVDSIKNRKSDDNITPENKAKIQAAIETALLWYENNVAKNYKLLDIWILYKVGRAVHGALNEIENTIRDDITIDSVQISIVDLLNEIYIEHIVPHLNLQDAAEPQDAAGPQDATTN